jgi:hypothetical protein
MAKDTKTVSIKTAMKHTTSTGVQGDSTEEKDGFLFGWEGLSAEPLIYEARAIVDNVWPNTETPDITGGVWDHTPIMQAVLVALRRGIEIGEGDGVATA